MVLRGIIHGKTIQLEDDPRISDGQNVEVILLVPSPLRLPRWGEGLRRCAGLLAESGAEQDDRILEEIHQERHSETRPETAE